MVNLDKNALFVNLHAATKKYFGPRAAADFVYGAAGDVWCVFEFSRPGSREKAAESAQTAAGASTCSQTECPLTQEPPTYLCRAG